MLDHLHNPVECARGTLKIRLKTSKYKRGGLRDPRSDIDCDRRQTFTGPGLKVSHGLLEYTVLIGQQLGMNVHSISLGWGEWGVDATTTADRSLASPL